MLLGICHRIKDRHWLRQRLGSAPAGIEACGDLEYIWCAGNWSDLPSIRPQYSAIHERSATKDSVAPFQGMLAELTFRAPLEISMQRKQIGSTCSTMPREVLVELHFMNARNLASAARPQVAIFFSLAVLCQRHEATPSGQGPT